MTRTTLLPCLAVLAVPLAAVTGLAAQEPTAGERLPVVERTLDNGLRLLVLPREGAPTVSFVLQYEVGSVNETLGGTGTAHLLEHMLFKGTTTIGTRSFEAERVLFALMDEVMDSIIGERSGREAADSALLERLVGRLRQLEDSARAFVVPNELDEILSRHGARGLNASTGPETTTYYVQLPANRAELWFALEADRLANPVFREFYAERDVVMEERRARTETEPSGRLYEALLSTAFWIHPYRVPVIGYMSDLRSLTRTHVREWYRRFYGPNNAVLAVVGDIDPGQVVTWAERYLGGLPRGEEPRQVTAIEPEQSGERRVQVVMEAEPQLLIGWRVPSSLHADAAPLSVLATLLTGGRTSRLYRKLVLEERIATGVSASVGPGERFPTLFILGATPRAPHGTAEIERAVYAELDRLAEAPPDVRELERVRNAIEVANWARLASNFGLAFQLAESETLYGDWRETFRTLDALKGVTPGDVQRVAREYFGPEKRTVAVLVPDGEGTAP